MCRIDMPVVKCYCTLTKIIHAFFKKHLYNRPLCRYNEIESKSFDLGTKSICIRLHSTSRRLIPMHVLLSAASFEQYENDEREISVPLKLPKKQFFALLELLGPCLEDHPHYHVQLTNDERRYVYLCFDLIGK